MARPIYIKRILLSLLIATILFLAGFFVSYSITYMGQGSIAIAQEEIRYNLLNLEIEKQLVLESCEIFDPYVLATELSEMGNNLEILEKRFGRHDERVVSQKKIYALLEIQHFLLVKEHNEKCQNGFPTILFFYSNEANYVNNADKMGKILSQVKKQKEVMIYSFDYDIETNLLNILKKKYNITEPNTIIINEGIKQENLQNIDDLSEF